MSSSFTPGPWQYVAMLSASENHKGFFVRASKPKGGGLWALATVQPGDEDGTIGEANARLISAAPDLLEALRDMVSDHTDLSAATLQFARAAIAKAEGEVQA